MRALQESVDRLASAFDRMAERLDGIDGNGGLAPSDADKFTRHIRRYMPFYALATIWALMLLILPTKQGNDTDAQSAGQVTAGADQNYGAGTDGKVAAGGGTRAGQAAGGARSTIDAATGTTTIAGVSEFNPVAWTAKGKTKAGFDCGPGIRQLPWSAYAVPCYPAWSGNNGGATSRGVTAKEITVVVRNFPDSAQSAAVDQFVQQAGFASSDEFDETRQIFYKYFNNVFELWGRKLKLIEYTAKYGDSTQEATGGGKSNACLDADNIIAKYKPFAVVGAGSTGVFGECGAERKLIVLGAGSYYNEGWYRKYHPYVWNGVTECERIAYQSAEYIGKRLARTTYNATTKKWVTAPAKWAKRLEKNKPRVFGTYVPTNEQYQYCLDIAAKEMETKYHVYEKDQSRFNYQLDVARFADQANQAIVQFHRDGVTTMVLACDPYSVLFLTQSARSQEFWPEWWINGAALNDVDQFPRLWDQEEIQSSLFGMSQLGANEKYLGPKGEAVIAYRKATGEQIPPGTQTQYFLMMGLYSILQAPGPVLTPHNMGEAYFRLPPGGAPRFEVGLVNYQNAPNGAKGGHDHTGIDDSREVYWVCTDIAARNAARDTTRCEEPKGFDGKGGTYRETYNGKRFTNGQWPKGEPPVYPEGGGA